MAFVPSTIFQPQYAATSAAAALVFFPSSGAQIATGLLYQINAAWAANNSSSPCWLEIYRVPSGGAADATTRVGPRITIPVANLSVPNVPLAMLWGSQLNPGDKIYALAQTASIIVLTADGGISTP